MGPAAGLCGDEHSEPGRCPGSILYGFPAAVYLVDESN